MDRVEQILIEINEMKKLIDHTNNRPYDKRFIAHIDNIENHLLDIIEHATWKHANPIADRYIEKQTKEQAKEQAKDRFLIRKEPQQDKRRCKIVNDYHDTLCEGTFHQWGLEVHKDGSHSVGIVENDNGSITTVLPRSIVFID